MTKRNWFDVNPRTGRIRGTMFITDEKALELIERGWNLVPHGGVAKLMATIEAELDNPTASM